MLNMFKKNKDEPANPVKDFNILIEEVSGREHEVLIESSHLKNPDAIMDKIAKNGFVCIKKEKDHSVFVNNHAIYKVKIKNK